MHNHSWSARNNLLCDLCSVLLLHQAELLVVMKTDRSLNVPRVLFLNFYAFIFKIKMYLETLTSSRLGGEDKEQTVK